MYFNVEHIFSEIFLRAIFVVKLNDTKNFTLDQRLYHNVVPRFLKWAA